MHRPNSVLADVLQLQRDVSGAAASALAVAQVQHEQQQIAAKEEQQQALQEAKQQVEQLQQQLQELQRQVLQVGVVCIVKIRHCTYQTAAALYGAWQSSYLVF